MYYFNAVKMVCWLGSCCPPRRDVRAAKQKKRNFWNAYKWMAWRILERLKKVRKLFAKEGVFKRSCFLLPAGSYPDSISLAPAQTNDPRRYRKSAIVRQPFAPASFGSYVLFINVNRVRMFNPAPGIVQHDKPEPLQKLP